jgi:hypothetical protein
LFGGLFIHDLGKLTGNPDYESQSLSWLEEWQFSRRIAEVGYQIGVEPAETWKLPVILRVLVGKQRWYEKMGSLPVLQIMQTWLTDVDIQRFLGVNRYKDILWFSQEAYEQLVWWMVTVSVLQATASPHFTLAHFLETILGSYEIALQLLAAEEESDFQISKLIIALGAPGETID